MTNRACTKNNGDGLLYSILCRDLWDTSPMLCHLSYEVKSVRVGHICWTHRRTGQGGGRGGSCPNISWAKSGKLKSPKAKKPPVCWANKGSRAILAYYKKNWDKLCQFCG
jgi:hypothetical protein